MILAQQTLKLSLALIVGAIYLAMGYLATASDHPPLVAILAGLFPLAAIAFTIAWHSRLRYLALALFAVGALLIALNIDQVSSHAAWIYFIQHAGTMILLGITFGSTLWASHAEALCSRIASFMIQQPLDARYLEYTWKVTFAWTLFFALSALTSVLLFFWGNIESWSIFANLLTPLLLGLMFSGEYLIRLRVLPGRSHLNIAQIINAYRDYSRRQPPQ